MLLFLFAFGQLFIRRALTLFLSFLFFLSISLFLSISKTTTPTFNSSNLYKNLYQQPQGAVSSPVHRFYHQEFYTPNISPLPDIPSACSPQQDELWFKSIRRNNKETDGSLAFPRTGRTQLIAEAKTRNREMDIANLIRQESYELVILSANHSHTNHCTCSTTTTAAHTGIAYGLTLDDPFGAHHLEFVETWMDTELWSHFAMKVMWRNSRYVWCIHDQQRNPAKVWLQSKSPVIYTIKPKYAISRANHNLEQFEIREPRLRYPPSALAGGINIGQSPQHGGCGFLELRRCACC